MFVLQRRKSNRYATEGELFLDGAKICDTLEPSEGSGLLLKEGCYKLIITKSPKFKEWLPLLMGTEPRSGIRIHAGNFPRHTGGCILVGKRDRENHIESSRYWLEYVIHAIRGEASRSGHLSELVINNYQ